MKTFWNLRDLSLRKRTAILAAALLFCMSVVQPALVMAENPAPLYEVNMDGADESAIPDDATIMPGQVLTGKSVKHIEGTNRFEITLSAVARAFEVTRETQKKKTYDVVFVLDYSGSMNETNFANMKTAAKNAFNEIVKNNEPGLYNRAAVVAFSDKDNTKVLQPLTAEAKGITDATLRGVGQKNCTYTQGGLYEAYKLLKAGRDDGTTAIPMIVLMSDGAPNSHVTAWNPNLDPTGAPTNAGSASGEPESAYQTVLYMKAVAAALKGMKSQVGFEMYDDLEFYTIGYGVGNSDLAKMVLDPGDANVLKVYPDSGNQTAKKNNKDKRDAITAAGENPVTKYVGSGLDANSIANAFDTVIESVLHNDPISGFLTIKDTIGSGFEIVEDSVSGADYTIADGQVIWKFSPTKTLGTSDSAIGVSTNEPFTFAQAKGADCVYTLTFTVELVAEPDASGAIVYRTNYPVGWEDDTDAEPNLATFKPLDDRDSADGPNPWYYEPGGAPRTDFGGSMGAGGVVTQTLRSSGSITVPKKPDEPDEPALPEPDPEPVTVSLQKLFTVADAADYDAEANVTANAALGRMTPDCGRDEGSALLCAHEHSADCYTETEEGAGAYTRGEGEDPETGDPTYEFTPREGGDWDLTCEHGTDTHPEDCYGEAHTHDLACYVYVFTFALADEDGNVVDTETLSVPADEMADYLTAECAANPVTFTIPVASLPDEGEAKFTFTETSDAYDGWANACHAPVYADADGNVTYGSLTVNDDGEKEYVHDPDVTRATMTNTFVGVENSTEEPEPEDEPPLGGDDDDDDTPPVVPPGDDDDDDDDDTPPVTPPGDDDGDDTDTGNTGDGDDTDTGNTGDGDDNDTGNTGTGSRPVRPGGGGDTTPPSGGTTSTPPAGGTTLTGGGENAAPASGQAPPAPALAQTAAVATVATASADATPAAPTATIFDAPVPLGGAPDMKTITPDAVPLAAPPAWALMNLILTVLSVAFSAVLILRALDKSRDRDERRAQRARRLSMTARALAVVTSAGMILAFVLTENVKLSMVMTDSRTPLMVVLFAVHVLFIGLMAYASGKHDQDPTPEAV